jgi:3-oxoadipate enol-lactonase
MPDPSPITTVRIGPTPAIAVDYCGQGDLLLFLHGVGGHRSNWTDQLAAFGTRYLCVAWDARGYGDSDDYEGPFRYSDVADDVLRVMAHFGKATAHLVGLSMGGRIAIDFHARHPEAVSSLVIADCLAGQYPPERRNNFLAMRQKPLLDGGSPRDIAAEVARSLVSSGAHPAAYSRLVNSMSLARRESYLKAVAAGQAYDRSRELSDIRVPALLLAGSDDMLTTSADMREMQRKVRGARFVEIPGAGHLSNIEQPGLFNRHLADFLDEQRVPSR